MQTLQTTSLRVSENQLFILDQQALPQEKRWLAADNVALLVDHIHTLRVRGAPLIGLSASLLLALLAQRGLNRDALQQALETLRAARPTAVNLMNNLDRMKQALAREDYPQALEAEALRLVEEDKQLCDRIAEAGSALVKPGSRLLTHCNTGGLATAGVGTALGVCAGQRITDVVPGLEKKVFPGPDKHRAATAGPWLPPGRMIGRYADRGR